MDVEVAVTLLDEPDASGSTPAIVLTMREISERKRADATLRESEERLTLAFAGAQEGVWDWNLVTGDVVYSPRWKQMLGYADRRDRAARERVGTAAAPRRHAARARGERERRARRARHTRASSGSSTKTATTFRSSPAAIRSAASQAARSYASSARTSISRSGARPKPSARARSCCLGSCLRRRTSGAASPARCTISSASS